MTARGLKVGLIIGTGLLVAVLIGSLASAKAGTTELPEYVGSRACLGCHTEAYAHWQETGHAHMVDPVFKPEDFPADPSTAAPELRAELIRADYRVAGNRFIGRDENGELRYLGVQWDPEAGQYVSYGGGGSSWEANCAGCHSVGWNPETGRFAEAAIGCESCHGPGRDHVINHGDRSQIVVDTSSETCGSCHNGGSMPDGTRWPADFEPGMLMEESDFNLKPVDPEGPPPDPSQHLRQFALLQATGHYDAMDSLRESGHAGASCAACHSAAAFIAQQRGEPVENWETLDDGVSCVACHDPHSDTNPAQLRLPANELCITCHNGHLEGEAEPGSTIHHPMMEMFLGSGGIGVEGNPSIHHPDEVTCVDCHMTEGNHMFKVIQPRDVAGTDRLDSCVTCHQESSPESRQAYLDMWQNTTRTRLAAVRALLEQVDAGLKDNPGAPAALKEKRDVAYTNITYVEADGSDGVHNFDYVMKLLNAAEKNLQEVQAALR